ncbi:MAG: AarF/ABC1/UbiB kinase family protein [Solirubrobacteraceae bacterium]|nr:AarF/ABC1/UbiB kinase family protein [Solirubrobacteraceae bacterium]
MLSPSPAMPATPSIPPLPRLDLLVQRSTRLAEIDGLPAEAARWQRDAVQRRREIQREARDLATPRVWHDTISGLAGSAWRVATAAAPEAPLVLLSAAAEALGTPIGPPIRGGGAMIERAQKVVRAGGPAYIKLGQFIATGDGLLPDEWVRAFHWCRDEAPSLRPGKAEEIVYRELGEDADRIRSMERLPLAAGSIGQVHRGRLNDGTEVVIKVRRPRLGRRLRKDIESLALVAAAAPRLRPEIESANLEGFVELFAELVLEELDFRMEAANLVEATAVLESLGAEHVRAPRPIPGMVTERVLVMELLPGVSYAKLPPEAAGGERGAELLRVGVQSVIEATLVHGVFHGDMHAGNVLIDERGGFSLVDLGITGRLDAEQRAGLVRFLVGFAGSDARVMMEAMRTFGAVSDDVDLARLIARLQIELEAIDARDAGAITFERLGQVLGSLLRILGAAGVTLPKDLVLFFKNLLYLSGFSAAVAPDADLFAVIQGILADVFAREDLAALLVPPGE